MILTSKATNNFEIKVKNSAGSATAKTNVIYKEKPVSKNPPKVTITSTSQPSVNPFDQDKGRSTIIAKITNITSKSQISVKVNGASISSSKINWDQNSNTMNVTVDVVRGENKVCLLYTSPSPRDATLSRMPSSA